MSKKLHNISKVIVSEHVASSNPILPIIVVKHVIEGGSGSLTESIIGGQVSIHVELNEGHEIKGTALEEGSLVYITGEKEGAPFTLSGALTTDHPKRPWKFSSVSGSSR